MGLEQVPDDIPIGMTLAALDAGGIGRAGLSAWYGPKGALISNEEVIKYVDAYPDRFFGLASVDLHRPMHAVRSLRKAVKAGLRGVRILPWLWGLPPNDRRYYPIFAECVQLDGRRGVLALDQRGVLARALLHAQVSWCRRRGVLLRDRFYVIPRAGRGVPGSRL